MSKSTFFVGVLAVGALAAAGGNAFFTYTMTKPRAAVNTSLGDYDLTSVAGYAVDQTKGDVAVQLKHELKGGNTALVWEMAKNKPSGDRQEFDGTWDTLTGGLVFNPTDKTIKSLEVVIAVDSVVGYGAAHPAPTTLTETLRGNTPGMPAWFDIESHPEATFASTEIVTREGFDARVATQESLNKQSSALGGFEYLTFTGSHYSDYLYAGSNSAEDVWTHLICGMFELNGVEQLLAIPANVTFIGNDVSVDLAFQIQRSDFGVDGTIVGGWEVEDTAYLTASVASAPKGDALLAALQQQAEAISGNAAQIADLYSAQKQVADLQSKIAKLTDELETLKKSGVSAADAIDVASLPKTITDEIQYPGKQAIAIESVLVPGDGEVGPFYMAKHEVTWAMFYDWAYGADIDANEYASLQKDNLRPSPLYEDCNQLKLGLGNRPALSMSRTTAEAFAKWVSEQTGRNYRIPTDAEWQTALKLGGGIPESEDELLAQAVLVNNAEVQFDPPFLELTAPVGSMKPNALGIHDLIGNAAEWVTDTGADYYVRGGHFMLAADELTADWKATEDQYVWNETYPQLPVSKFWYRDHYYQGIRLVADVE